MIRYVDLFAGIGGIRLGFEQALSQLDRQSKCVLSSEIDDHAQKTYSLNFNEKPLGDIYKIEKFPPFDFLLAGFPCQPFSYAGKQKGFGDTRGTLFFKIEQLLKEHQPKAFLLENVRGLTTHDHGRTFKTIIEKLEGLNYGVNYFILNSSNFQVPQNRVRVYIVGLKNRTPKTEIISNLGPSSSHKFRRNIDQGLMKGIKYSTVQEILEENPSTKFDCSPAFAGVLKQTLKQKRLRIDGVRLIDFRNGKSVHSWELGLKGECTEDEILFMNALIENRRKKIFGTHQDGKSLSVEQIATFFHSDNTEKIIDSLIKKKYLRERDGLYNPVSGNMSFEVFKFLDPESISITLVSSDAHKIGVLHKGRMRRITPRECARLQGYPDSFQCHPVDTHAYKQFGNSVSVPVIKAVVLDLFKNNTI
jgi:DNA (cytosine-5)-methyltransferase 1